MAMVITAAVIIKKERYKGGINMIKSLLIGGQPSIQVIDTYSGEIAYTDQLSAKQIILDLFNQGHEIYLERKTI